MAKILLEVVIDTTKGKAGIEELKQQLESVGVSGTKLAEALAQDERALQRLLDRAEPARVAAERLAKAEDLLKDGRRRRQAEQGTGGRGPRHAEGEVHGTR